MPKMKYIKMIKDGAIELIQEDRVERFLEVGYQIFDTSTLEKKSPAKRGKKDRITANAQVTSIKEEEAEEEWDPTSGEDWADSEESVYAPEGERLIDADSNNAKEEN